METEYPGVKNGQGVYLQLKFSTKNCQVGFKMRKKNNNTKLNQRENFLRRKKKYYPSTIIRVYFIVEVKKKMFVFFLINRSFKLAQA